MSDTAVRVDPHRVRSLTENPYWDIVKTIPADSVDQMYPIPGKPWSPQSFGLKKALEGEFPGPSRDELCRQYAWAIPDPASLQFVWSHVVGQGVVEVGAGTGYWAWQLSQLGVDVAAYDLKPPNTCWNGYHGEGRYEERDETFRREVFHDVVALDATEAVRRHPDRTLLLCWPPYRSRMALNALTAFRGERVIFIGEGGGGCTAGHRFFQKLRSEWDEVADHRLVQWYGMHDWATVFDRHPGPPRPVEDRDDEWVVGMEDEEDEEG